MKKTQKKLFYEVYQTVIGDLTIAADDTAITHILFGTSDFSGTRQATPLTDCAYAQLEEYFSGKRKVFDLPLAPSGTEFQKRVWDALYTIPYGKTLCYAEIAELAGSPLACRAVGMANHHNPISIVIPCHRVIGKNGSLTGYGGGMELKQWLLERER